MGKVCQHHWQCRNMSEEARHENYYTSTVSPLYANSTILETNMTSDMEELFLECCNANESSTDYSGTTTTEVSPGVCCVREPVSVFVIIMSVIGMLLCIGAGCFICCYIRPKLESLCNRMQPNTMTRDDVQTAAALKTLSTPSGNPQVGGPAPMYQHPMPGSSCKQSQK